jgi:hypothetical protein
MEIVRAVEAASDNIQAPLLSTQLDCFVSAYPNFILTT